MISFLISFIACFGALFIISVTLKRLFASCKKPPNFPPGPMWLPFFGNTFSMKRISDEFGGQYLALLELARRYNTKILGLKLGKDRYVVVFGRKYVQQVLTGEEFQGRPDGFFIRLRTMGERRGITMTDGALWHHQRSFAERHLKRIGSTEKATRLFFGDHLKKFGNLLKENRRNVSLSGIFSSTFLDALWNVTAGKNISDEGDLSELLALLRERSKIFDMAGGLLNQLPQIRHFFPYYCGFHAILRLNAKLKDLFQKIIKEHKSSPTKEVRDFIDAYLIKMKSTSPDKKSIFTEDQLTAICMDFFIAGALTTSYTLDFAVIAVTKHPHVQKKIHEELDAVLRPGHVLSIDDKKKLPYLAAVLMESQRYQHVVPTAGPRRVLKDTTIGGYNIPKDTIVLISLRSVHRDGIKWNDADIFRPERFIDEYGNLVRDEGLSFFGLGKRRCPGEMLAKNFIFLTFATLFRYYYVTFPEDREVDDTPIPGILLSPQPYVVTLEQRRPVP